MTPPRSLPDPFLNRRDGACELWLIRHGDAVPEPDGLIASSYNDQPLSARGRAQADALAERLQAVSFAALYSSPFLRCVQTAEPLRALNGMSLMLVDAVREVQQDADGKRAAIQNAADSVWSFLDGGYRIGVHAMTYGTFDGLPGAEPRAQFRSRVREALAGLAARHTGERIAVFAHGGVINVYAAEVLGLARDFFMPIANTAISVVRVKGAQRMIVTLNDHCHLRRGHDAAQKSNAG